MGMMCLEVSRKVGVLVAAYLFMLFGMQNSTVAAELQYYKGPDETPLAYRAALVLGVSHYDDPMFPYLPNPQNDVKLVRELLISLGFEVFPKAEDIPLTKQTIKRHLYDFARKLKERGGAGVFYFAGHGVSLGNESYLVPKDGMIQFERDLNEELIPMGLLYDTMREAKDVFHIAILDACRNAGLGTLKQFRKENTSGLANGVQLPADPPKNSIIASSASNGQVAQDGEPGGNSPYAMAFKAAVQHSNEPVEATLKRIVEYVQAMPNNRGANAQEPISVNKASGRFYFAPTQDTYRMEKEDWESVAAGPRSAMYAGAYDYFIRRYPAGYFTETAKRTRASLPVTLAQTASNVKVIASNLNVRQAPEKDSARNITVSKDTVLRVLPGSTDLPEGWTRVQLKNGNVGYVASKHVKEIQSLAPTETKVTLKYEEHNGVSTEKLSALESKVDWQNLKQVKLLVNPSDSVEQVSKGLSAIVGKLESQKVDPLIVETFMQPAKNNLSRNAIDFIAVTARPAM